MNAKHLVTAAVGFGMTAVGCLGAPSDEEIRAMELDPAAYETLDNPTGSGTSNHLVPKKFHDNKYKLLDAMDHALRSTAHARELSPDVVSTGIMGTTDSREVFTMAAQCALADGDYITYTVGGGSHTYPGNGLMSTTAGWATGALTESQKEDVFRCLVARMNAEGEHIDIALTGMNVTNKPSETKPTGMVEDALWDVDIVNYVILGQTMTVINVYAWSLAVYGPSNVAACSEESGDIKKRVCDDDSTNCNVTAYESSTADCYAYGRNGGGVPYYKCKHGNPSQGRPVVESWVTESLIPYIYPSCYTIELPPITINPEFIPNSP